MRKGRGRKGRAGLYARRWGSQSPGSQWPDLKNRLEIRIGQKQRETVRSGGVVRSSHKPATTPPQRLPPPAASPAAGLNWVPVRRRDQEGGRCWQAAAKTRRVPQVPVQVGTCASPPTETRSMFTHRCGGLRRRRQQPREPRTGTLSDSRRFPVSAQREGPPALGSEGARGRRTNGDLGGLLGGGEARPRAGAEAVQAGKGVSPWRSPAAPD